MSIGHLFNVCLCFILACLWLGFIFLLALATFNP
jgi:hypothetical protein